MTQTQHDRDLLRRALQISGVLMAITLLANGLRLTGTWDELMAWMQPDEPDQPERAVDAEDEEDELLAEQLYRKHQRWAEQQERDQAFARLLEQNNRRELELLTASDAQAVGAGLATQVATTTEHQSPVPSSPRSQPASLPGPMVAVNT